MPNRLLSFLGILVLLFIAWLLSNNRQKVPWRVIVWGMALQFFFALFILKTSAGLAVFDGARNVISGILDFTTAGAYFVFGPLALNPGNPAHTRFGQPMGFFFFFSVLTTIIFFASLMNVLYHLGVMQFVVRKFAWVMMKTMGTSGAESLSAAANIFVGQTEAPLVVKPYVDTMTESELMAVMTGGFATVAGGVMAAYVSFGVDAGHLLAASVMSAPAALVAAKLMVPETAEPLTRGQVRIEAERTTVNVIDAAATGASEGMKLTLNVAAMLLAFLALVAMVDSLLGLVDAYLVRAAVGRTLGLTLQKLLGWFFAPIAYCMGIEGDDVIPFASLQGTKIALNEFVAFLNLRELRDTLSPRSFVIATYALCGFGNFGSIAIQIGGIGGIAPERRHDLARLGLRAMIAGTIGCWITASLAGVLISDEEANWRYLKDVKVRLESVTRFQQPARVCRTLIESDNAGHRQLGNSVLSELKKQARQVFTRAEKEAQEKLRTNDAEGARKIYEQLLENIAFPNLKEAIQKKLENSTHVVE